MRVICVPNKDGVRPFVPRPSQRQHQSSNTLPLVLWGSQSRHSSSLLLLVPNAHDNRLYCIAMDRGTWRCVARVVGGVRRGPLAHLMGRNPPGSHPGHHQMQRSFVNDPIAAGQVISLDAHTVFNQLSMAFELTRLRAGAAEPCHSRLRHHAQGARVLP